MKGYDYKTVKAPVEVHELIKRVALHEQRHQWAVVERAVRMYAAKHCPQMLEVKS